VVLEGVGIEVVKQRREGKGGENPAWDAVWRSEVQMNYMCISG